MLKSICVVLLTCSACLGQERAQTTCSLDNGHHWQSGSESYRIGYLAGVMDAMMQVHQYKEYFPDGVTAGDVSKTVSKLYDDPANVLIPIVDILITAKHRFEGVSSEIINLQLQELRKASMECFKPGQ